MPTTPSLALAADDQQERPVVGGKWLLRHMDAEEFSRASRYLGQGAQTCFRAAARLIAPPATHLSCPELEYEPVLVLARFLLAPASKRKSGTSWAGYRSGTNSAVSWSDQVATASEGNALPRAA